MSKAMRDFDIVIVGGGISGLGVAYEAAQHGFSVAVLEKERCCHATSANSLRIIHGGFRYLQTLNFTRVFESLGEQNYWLKTAPDLVKPLPCFLPLRKFGFKSYLPLSVASKLYEALSHHCCGRANGSKIVSKSYVEEHVPVLRGGVPYGALLWHDALLEDLPAFVEFVKTRTERAGTEVIERTKVVALNHQEKGFVISCEGENGPEEFSAKIVINTTGPWLSSVSPQSLTFQRQFPAGWCKACNVILRRQIEQHYAFGITGEAGRVFFFVPRGEKTAAGTWYLPYSGSADSLSMSEEELSVFLGAMNRAFQGLHLTLDDVDAVECGVLPMRRVSKNGPVLYGSHHLNATAGFIDVMSTKFTTFRSQGKQVMELARPFLAGHGA